MDQMPAMTTSAVAVTAAKDRTLFMEPSLRLAMRLSLAQRPCASSWQDKHYDALIVQPGMSVRDQARADERQMNAPKRSAPPRNERVECHAPQAVPSPSTFRKMRAANPTRPAKQRWS